MGSLEKLDFIIISKGTNPERVEIDGAWDRNRTGTVLSTEGF